MKKYAIFLLSLFLIFAAPSFAAYTQINGKWVNSKFIPTKTAPDHFEQGCRLFYESKWREALNHFMVINYYFSQTPFYPDALYNSAMCYYSMGDFDLANEKFDQYLLLSGKLKYFEKVFEMKFEIAEAFRLGKKKHPFGFAAIPKWAPAKKDALALYEEINVALPASELAAKALISKGELLRTRRKYKDSIDSFQVLTKRFPKHSLAADSFLKISDVYVEQSLDEPQNPDILSLAFLNIQKFKKSFPSDERVTLAFNNYQKMQEIYAKSLYDTGLFYEKKKKRDASIIYYQDAIHQYPRTDAAHKSQERLIALKEDETMTTAG